MERFRRGEENSRVDHYPRFSKAEYERRWQLVADLMEAEGYDALVVYGLSTFADGNIPWLTNYRPPFPTYLTWFADPDEAPTLFAGISNHVQYIREVSEIDDVRVSIPDPPARVADRLAEAGAAAGRIGLVGTDPRYALSIPHTHYASLRAALDAEFEDATVPFTRLMSVHSPEELEAVERAATVLDRGMAALETIEPGCREDELPGVLRSGGTGPGAIVSVLLSSAPMRDAGPGESLPWKTTPATRTVEVGDVVTTEITAASGGVRSQIHRPYAIGEGPTALYADLFDVAHEAYEGMVDALRPGNTAHDVYEAVRPVEASDYKSYDVMLHGFGNAYSHPFIGTADSNYWPGIEDPPTEEWVFEEHMVMVVQPNVVTTDERAGLQLGTTVVVREDGPEVVQEYPVEFVEVAT